jgi:DNA replication protein DnaC
MHIGRNAFFPEECGTDPNAEIATLTSDQHRDAISDWVAKPGGTLILAGPTGTGKTYAAEAIANHFLLATTRAVIGRDERSLLDGWENPNTRSMVHSASIVILDELGASRDLQAMAPPNERATLRSIIDTLKGALIVTTTLSSTHVAAVYGDDIASRLAHRATVLSFLGKNWRAPEGLDNLW